MFIDKIENDKLIKSLSDEYIKKYKKLIKKIDKEIKRVSSALSRIREKEKISQFFLIFSESRSFVREERERRRERGRREKREGGGEGENEGSGGGWAPQVPSQQRSC